MELIVTFLLGFFVFIDHGGDPIFTAFEGRRAVRDLECERLPQAEAHRRYPGRVPAPSPRGETLIESDALVCGHRLTPFGARPPQDELIIDGLGGEIASLTQLATVAVPNGNERVWSVDGFYPDIEIATRIASAARTELAARGFRVTNKAPLLAAGDLLVLRQLDGKDAFALACERYFAEGALGAGDALLALAIIDARESELHAGVCADGGWRWLR